MKYVVVIGSVMSGIGKGITASSIGVVLKSHGLNVTAIKIDPYLNIDSGTMSPFEHGECYVLNDGGETDLDLGNYERFLDLNLTRDHNITTGKIYSQIINDERNGKYLGRTVQVIPHVTNAVQSWIERVALLPVGGGGGSIANDVCIIELGGTIGDLESDAYVEALRQLGFRLGRENVCYVNVCYCPVMGDEVKTKPAQNGIAEMRRRGINPDLLIVRCERNPDQSTIDKLGNFCQIDHDHIIINQNVQNIYQVPLNFHFNNVYSLIAKQLKLGGLVGTDNMGADDITSINMNGVDQGYIQKWISIADHINNPGLKQLNIGIIGKYTGLTDSYLSLSHAIRDAGLAIGVRCNLTFVDASTLECGEASGVEKILSKFDRLIIPGGFGNRGIEGMIITANYARIHHVPCLGICLGFQIMVIEYSRNVLGLPTANSTEFDTETVDPVITIMERDQVIMGGSMRLGLHTTRLAKNSYAWRAYNSVVDASDSGGINEVDERHRHRYEVNPKYIERFDSADLWFSGVSLDGVRMEICEILGGSSFYMGVQFHPEYLTRPNKPHPVFIAWLSNSV